MLCVGVDGCRAGWLAIAFSRTGWKVAVLPSISSLWAKYQKADQILIDIPIGLPDRGDEKRRCDVEARRLVGTRRGSVFPVPCRAAVYARTYQEANEKNHPRKLPRQTWGLVPKIKEVDEFLSQNKDARSRIRETHPELCFWAFNNCQPLANPKKKTNGMRERKRLLASINPRTEEMFEYAVKTFKRKEVARDDILDALVVAVTATRKLCSIPEIPQFDSRGLRMEIVYPKPGGQPCL